jgi:hypothetical protein
MTSDELNALLISCSSTSAEILFSHAVNSYFCKAPYMSTVKSSVFDDRRQEYTEKSGQDSWIHSNLEPAR